MLSTVGFSILILMYVIYLILDLLCTHKVQHSFGLLGLKFLDSWFFLDNSLIVLVCNKNIQMVLYLLGSL